MVYEQRFDCFVVAASYFEFVMCLPFVCFYLNHDTEVVNLEFI